MSPSFIEHSLATFVFLFGLIVGSFLNVLIFRLRTGAKIANDRSRCMSCGRTLTARMLIPVLSFLLQKGRCAYCRTKLSWQYPIVEILGGVLTVVVFFHTMSLSSLGSLPRWVLFFVDSAFFWTLLVMSVYDLRHKIIPDRLTLVLAFFALGHLFLSIHLQEVSLISSIIIGCGVSFFFFLFWFLSRGRWMGFGDVKLALPLGAFLGSPIGVSLPILAFWIGTIPAVGLLIFRRGTTMKSEIPFGPFLALATLFLYAFPIDILQLKNIWPHLF